MKYGMERQRVRVKYGVEQRRVSAELVAKAKCDGAKEPQEINLCDGSKEPQEIILCFATEQKSPDDNEYKSSAKNGVMGLFIFNFHAEVCRWGS